MLKIINSPSRQYSIDSCYNLRTQNLREIIKVLEFSRDNIKEAVAFKIVIQIEESFDIKRMSKLIKSKLQSYGFGLAYSVEHAARAGLHVHLMICISSRGRKSPISVLHTIRESLGNLEGVISAKAFAKRTEEDTSNKDYFHRLHKENEFSDAVMRYSYIAKNEDKADVQRAKKFGTSKAKGTSKKVNVVATV